MNETELLSQLRTLASEAVPSARPLPSDVNKRARRGQFRSGLAVATALITLFAGGIYAVNSSRNIVGPAPMAGDNSQDVFDPPDHAFTSGYSLDAEMVDGRICVLFDVEVHEFEEHRSTARVCEPEPAGVLSVATALVTLDTDPPTELVVVGGGVAPNVARIEIVVPHDKFPVREIPIIDALRDQERRVTGEMLERDTMLDAKGRFRATIRAFDVEGNLLYKQALCDPADSAPSCE